MQRLRAISFLWCGIVCGGRSSLACQCAELKPPACQQVWSAALVFAGTVERAEHFEDSQQFPWIKVHFVVTEVFAGPTPNIKEIDVLTLAGGPACGFDFEVGHSYLVYAERTPSGELRANHCMRTAPMEDSSGDLAYLRSLPTLRPVGQITGTCSS